MMDEWYYKSFGEEQGPVSFERMREMASKNQLSPQDRVRPAAISEWIEARSVAQLFPHLQAEADQVSVDDLDEAEFETIQLASEEERKLASLDELDIQISDAPTGVRKSAGPVDSYGSPLHESSPDEEPAEPDSGDQWICEVLGVQLGPMSEHDLYLLARQGEVGLDDPVCKVGESDWRPAKTVEGLFPGFEYRGDETLPDVAPPTNPDGHLPDSAGLGDDFEQALAGLPGAERPEQSPGDAKESPTEEKEKNRASPAPKPKRKSQAPAKANKTKAKRSAPAEDKEDQFAKWLSESAPEDPPSVPETSSVTSDEQPAESTEPSEESGKSADFAAAQLQRQQEAQAAQKSAASSPAPVIAPPKKPKKLKVNGPGLGERFSDLGQKLKENPKVLGVLAVLALVVAIKYMPWSFGTGDQEYLDQITQYANTYREMREKNASASEYDSFKKEALAVLEPLEKELNDLGGTDDRPKQELYWACGKLEEMISAGIGKEKSEAEEYFDKHIANARELIQEK